MEAIISKQFQSILENRIQDELNEESMFIDVDDPATKITYEFKSNEVLVTVVNGKARYYTSFNYLEL